MSLVIELPPLVESRLEAEAQRSGISPAELVVQVVNKTFASALDLEEQKRLNASSIALLQSWIAEAPTEPEDVKEAEQDLREFKQNLNASRKEAGARLLFPEVE